jgi:hypothetical protein
MTWNLVEALTGLETGDDWNNNGRGSEVVTVKTHFPQSNGILPDFDERIHRAFIVIRNPLESIPSVSSLFFDRYAGICCVLPTELLPYLFYQFFSSLITFMK